MRATPSAALRARRRGSRLPMSLGNASKPTRSECNVAKSM
ncbi:hypothetical protein L665_03298 [Ralstonia solanacearum SD54]|nr:hypothetical protein F504_2139 [Ralstonia pseudosolanacearum FQY_4]ANH32534.1 hypothetical protein A3768_1373 [Ralstonia solanacearum]ESS46915.1 hypothetical protein L665_03298 [Ralstonia solanacearum SD54]